MWLADANYTAAAVNAGGMGFLTAKTFPDPGHFRNELEKANLLYWQVTCEAFNTPQEWKGIFNQAGYTGDYSFIYFE